jgi:hypothetical protein
MAIGDAPDAGAVAVAQTALTQLSATPADAGERIADIPALLLDVTGPASSARPVPTGSCTAVTLGWSCAGRSGVGAHGAWASEA